MILPDLSNTGPAIVVKDLSTGLISQGHECKVFYFDDKVELEMPCLIERIAFSSSINFEEWEVIHSHMFRPDLYVRLHFLYKSKKKRPFLITTLHNPISYKAFRTGFGHMQSFIGCVLWKLALTAFDKIVVLNSDTYNHIRGIERKKLNIVHNGRNITPKETIINREDRDAILALKQKYILVGTISSISKRKGLEQMIYALTFLPNYAFVAVGEGPELSNLQDLAISLKVSDRCYWTGYRKDAVHYQSLFDIFVMCSRSEGFPLALIEAAAYAKPIVLSDISILKSIVSVKEVAFYRLDDIASLAFEIRQMYAKRKEYSKHIHDYYLENLTVNKMVNKYVKLYSSLRK